MMAPSPFTPWRPGDAYSLEKEVRDILGFNTMSPHMIGYFYSEAYRNKAKSISAKISFNLVGPGLILVDLG